MGGRQFWRSLPFAPLIHQQQTLLPPRSGRLHTVRERVYVVSMAVEDVHRRNGTRYVAALSANSSHNSLTTHNSLDVHSVHEFHSGVIACSSSPHRVVGPAGRGLLVGVGAHSRNPLAARGRVELMRGGDRAPSRGNDRAEEKGGGRARHLVKAAVLRMLGQEHLEDRHVQFNIELQCGDNGL